ncbi:MAG: hypothetical protein HQL46_14785 [Gammaproteobacteria bacterium]|nr:hypothetical protein [Gammaproteobacteria bacterium]
MSKLIVKNTEGMKTPFLRGIVTSSLLDSGVSFNIAYQIATEIRNSTQNINEIRSSDLRQLIAEQLKHNNVSQLAINRFLSDNHNTDTILVRRENQQAEPFSRGQHRLCLEACGLSVDAATSITSKIYEHLLKSKVTEISSNDLGLQTYYMLQDRLGETVARSYLVWTSYVRSNKPLILLIGGAAGVGKSTIATEVGHRMNIVRTQSTDMLREVMRMMTPKALSPVLHTSSYNAWKVLPDVSNSTKFDEKLLRSGYLRQSELLSVACEAIISRAIEEKVSLILEGVHIHPSLQEKITSNEGVILVPVLLSVLKASKLKEHFQGREGLAPGRYSTKYINNFDAIWELQSFLMGEADRYHVPIISNIRKDSAIQEVMKTINDSLYSYFPHEVEKVFKQA